MTYINFLLNNISIHTGHREKRENALIFLTNSLNQFSKECMEVSQDNLHVDVGSYRVKQTFFLGQAGN